VAHDGGVDEDRYREGETRIEARRTSMIANEAPTADNGALRQPGDFENLDCGSKTGRRLLVIATQLVVDTERPFSFLAETAPRHDHDSKVEVIFHAGDGVMPPLYGTFVIHLPSLTIISYTTMTTSL
jgi:hypothetical protein